MYVHAKIQAISIAEDLHGCFKTLPFEEAVFVRDKKWGVFGFDDNTGATELVCITSDLSRARERTKKIIEKAMSVYDISQVANFMLNKHRWLSATPSNFWQISYDYTIAKAFSYSINESGTTILQNSLNDLEADIYFVKAISNNVDTDLVDTCYSYHEAVQICNITNFIINPILQ